ncbi:MAG: hydrogenase nickel incorporation protein HypA [Candidatus Muproteobacteria bacterium RBG_16_65_34]|uniref:Hydrogenase maturation factor HypA n=1 Tax=Candidatus Muproteobacteria bacterium RBG_16_65_34 TaxID=1817760 RepID=A0A1F6TSE3_9PROT|nr:MAG: hydrogenase nickel incorporation protein HypA [Candidatus Muproteobacteria bacterium RBG_16_65_34]
MHELSVCQAMLREVARVAAGHDAAAVRRIVLRLGPLSGVEPDLLAEAFPLARAGTVADGAELVIERLPIRVRCDTCGAENEAAANRLLCSACGDWHTRLISGDELLLVCVELESNAECGMANAE